MNNQKHPIFTLFIIYLALLSVSIALYYLIILFIADKTQQSTAANLISWSATLFGTVALLYTFQSWRQQKGSEVVSSLCQELYIKLNDLNKAIDDNETKIINYPLMHKSEKPEYELWSQVNTVIDKFNDIEQSIIIIKSYEEIEEYIGIELEIFDLKQQYQFFYIKYQDYEKKYKTEDEKMEKKLQVIKEMVMFLSKFRDLKLKVDKVLVEYIFHRR